MSNSLGFNNLIDPLKIDDLRLTNKDIEDLHLNDDLHVGDDTHCDEIKEYTSGSGVKIDDILIKDDTIQYSGNLLLDSLNVAANSTTYIKNSNATYKSNLNVENDINASSLTLTNTISEFSLDTTLNDNSDSKLSSQKALKTYIDNNNHFTRATTIISNKVAGDTLKLDGDLLIDDIKENTLNVGVTIDGILIKDDNIDLSGNITCDTINEHTIDAGVTIEGSKFENNQVYLSSHLNTNSIVENTAGSGVTIDGVLCKDGDILLDSTNPHLKFEKNASGNMSLITFKSSTTDCFGVGQRSSNNLGMYNYQLSSYGFMLNATTNDICLSEPVHSNSITSNVHTLFIDDTGNLGGINGSLEKMKMNIKPLKTDIYKYEPISFNYRKKDKDDNYLDEISGNRCHYGLIAEECYKIDKNTCSYKDESKKTLENLVGIYNEQFIYLLISTCKKQKKEIDSLNKKMDMIINRLNHLETI